MKTRRGSCASASAQVYCSLDSTGEWLCFLLQSFRILYLDIRSLLILLPIKVS